MVKLNSSGGHVWSTYLGGSQADTGTDIAVDAAGSALVTGLTKSPGWVSGGFDTTYNGQEDVFVAKLSPDGSHVWSTYLGGNEDDRGFGISVDPAGAALVTGLTESFGWVSGGYDTTFNGGEGSRDGFVARLSSIDPLPADLTGDGFVDFVDLTWLLAHWNQNVSALEGNLVDAAGSPVNFADLTVLLAAWTGPGPAGAPVGRRLAAAVGGDSVGDVGGSGESVAVGDASYRRGDEAPRQAAAYAPLRRLQAAAVDRALADDSLRRDTRFARRSRRGH